MFREKFFKEVLPSIKKEIVKILYNKYKLKQKEIAKKLFITQALVSYYLRDLRGKDFEFNENIFKEIEEFCMQIAFKNLSKKELEEFFEKIRNLC